MVGGGGGRHGWRHHTLLLPPALLLLLYSTCVSSKENRSSVGDIENMRLPLNIRPIHYVVRLQAFLHGNHSVHGQVEIELEVVHRTSNITFHMADIHIRKDTVKVSPLNKRRIYLQRRQLYDPVRQQYTVQLRRRLRPGKAYLLTMRFRSSLADSPRGIYVDSYRDGEDRESAWHQVRLAVRCRPQLLSCFDSHVWKRDGSHILLTRSEKKKVHVASDAAGVTPAVYDNICGLPQLIGMVMAVTQFWATNARRAFPCFDEPEMKATFTLYIARERHMTALSNMPLVATTPMPGQEGWVWDQFATSLHMSTYLVAFFIADYTSRTTDGSTDTRVNIWTRRTVLEQTGLVLEAATFSVNFFASFFNISYPLQKLDMIAVPNTAFNGMENWGLIVYREHEVLWDPESASTPARSRVSELVAHELAHQWFGNLVTFKWWNDVWLNEGFATYMATVAVEKMEPSWRMLDQFLVTKVQQVMKADALRTSHPLSVSVPDPANINQVFDDIPYKKGAAVIRMMQHYLTADTFKKGLANYLSAMRYDNAVQDDLWMYMTLAAHEDGSLPPQVSVKTIMDPWTQQEGFPVIIVSRDHNGTARLTQERFVAGGEAPGESYRWWVPVTFTSQKRPTFRHTRAQTWLSSHAHHVTVTGLPPPQFWVIFNLQMTGYYRVNYDEYNWNLLVYQLQENHRVIHVTNRAQIIDDALNLARAGLLSYNIGLNVTTYLKSERSYVAWKAAFSNMHFLHVMFRHTAAYGALKDYLLEILQPLYESLGLENQPGDDLHTQLLREEVVRWACRLDHEACVRNSIRLFQQWIEDPENFRVASNVAEAVYCAAVQRGGQAEWEFVWHQFHAAEGGVLREALGMALGCSSQAWLLSRYVEAAVDGEAGLRRQDISHVFTALVNSDVGSFLAWQHLLHHWRHITEYVDGDFSSMSNMIKAATQHFNTGHQLEQLQLLASEAKSQTTVSALEKAVEAVQNNLAWRRKNFDTIVQWLNQRGFSHTLTVY